MTRADDERVIPKVFHQYWLETTDMAINTFVN